MYINLYLMAVSIRTLIITFQEAGSCSAVPESTLYFVRVFKKIIIIRLIKEVPCVTLKSFLRI